MQVRDSAAVAGQAENRVTQLLPQFLLRLSLSYKKGGKQVCLFRR